MVHTAPLVGHWPRHSPYHFREGFFSRLASAMGYEVVLEELQTTTYGRRSRVAKTNVSVVLVKAARRPFMPKEEFLSLGGVEGMAVDS